MPQFSPLWFINIISFTFAILSFVIWYVQSITFPSILSLNLSRMILTDCHLKGNEIDSKTLGVTEKEKI